jgi:hypothetical protein
MKGVTAGDVCACPQGGGSAAVAGVASAPYTSGPAPTRATVLMPASSRVRGERVGPVTCGDRLGVRITSLPSSSARTRMSGLRSLSTNECHVSLRFLSNEYPNACNSQSECITRTDNSATRLSYAHLFPVGSRRAATSRNAHAGPTWASCAITWSSRTVRGRSCNGH